MRTINSGKRLFGFVQIHNKEIYVDTQNGTGFYEIIEAMMGTIKNMSKRLYYLGYEDAYQEVCVFMLEGMLKYSPDKGASLSSFLYKYVSNKIVDTFRSKQDPLRGRHIYMTIHDDDAPSEPIPDVIESIELSQRIENWDDKWKEIVFKIFVQGESISDVAELEGMTRWGLSRAMKRKFKEARNI
jgi:RNA polymerase sigma factor (sigma-70 family)